MRHIVRLLVLVIGILIATATGLVIALICLIAYNYLSTKVKHFIYEVESMASRLVEIRMSVARSGPAPRGTKKK